MCSLSYWELLGIFSPFYFLFLNSVAHFHSMLCAHLTYDSQRTVGNRNKQTFYEFYHVSVLLFVFFSSWCSFLSFSFLKIEEKRNTLLIKTSNYIYIFIHIYSFSLYFFLYFIIPEVDLLTHIVACTLHMQISN